MNGKFYPFSNKETNMKPSKLLRSFLLAAGSSLLASVPLHAATFNLDLSTNNTGGIVLASGANDFTFGSFNVSYLIVGGGGSGGGVNSQDRAGGGGGAGGLRSGSTSITGLQSITVGAGGDRGAVDGSSAAIGTNGGNSVAFGLTAIGGGAGGTNSTIAGAAGGSGGGGGNNSSSAGAGGADNDANSLGSGGVAGTTSGPRRGGGGGGAGGTGSGATGGAGSSSSITGSAVTYAAGGNGGVVAAGTAVGSGAAGAANTGNGGGGAFRNTTGGPAGTSNTSLGGNGGSGIVVVSYAGTTQLLSGGTFSTAGGNSIHTFTTTGASSLDLHSATINGDISGTGGNLLWNKTGTLTLGGNNTYSGTTTVSSGILNLSNALALQNSALDTTASIAGSGTAGLRTTATTLTLGGLTGNKNFSASGGVFSTTSGGYGSVTALTLNPGTGASHSYAGVIANGASGMTLTKSGDGTQTLTNANTYSGNTTISGGSLALSGSGSIANSPVIQINSSTSLNVTGVTGGSFTIGSTQTVGGTGSLVATGTTIVADGTLSPGNSPGAMIVDGGVLQLGVGGDTNMQVFDASGLAGVGYDTVNLINGASLDLSLLSAGNTYNINLWSLSGIGPDVNGFATNFNNTLNYSWTLFNTGSAISGFSTDKFTLNLGAFNGTDGFTNALGGGSFSVGLADSNSNLVVNYTAIPEPGAALIGSLGLLALLRRRRA
jgi:hypothetical protein